MEIKNLTPHAIVVESQFGAPWRIEPSGDVARVAMTRNTPGERVYHEGDFVAVTWIEYGPVTGLPAPEEGVIYIVSSIVLAACRGRQDVVAPDTDRATRDDQGRIESVPGFVRFPAEGEAEARREKHAAQTERAAFRATLGD